MASLEMIMNVDEDSPDSDSHKRAQYSAPASSSTSVLATSTQALPSTSASTLAPGYIPSFNYAFPPPSSPAYNFNLQSAAAPSRNPHPFAPELSTSPSPYSHSADPANGRRVSSTSTESMDSHCQGSGFGQVYDEFGNSSSAGPSRTQGAVSGSKDGGQRLTPVTNRPSKALKGRLVHVCELCRPPKAFSRAEHLRRHVPSHSPPHLACSIPGCERVFWRQDLLDRHHLKHKQDGSLASVVGPPLPQERPINPRPDRGSKESNPRATAHDAVSHPVDHDSRSPPTWSAIAHGGTSGPEDHQLTDWQGYHATDGDWPSYPVHGIPRTSPGLPIAMSHPYSNMLTSPQQATIPYSHLADIHFTSYDENLDLTPHNPPHTTVRSLPLPLVVGPSSEILDTFPSETQAGSIGSSFSRGRSEGWQPDPLAIATLMMPTSLSEEARKNIPTYINVYWNKVHAASPLIHRSIFDDDQSNKRLPSELSKQRELRWCAMAAIATQFLEDKVHRIHGDELYAHAWFQSTEHKHSKAWTLETMQTIILCEYYARFRGKKRTSHLPSSQFRLLYQNVASYKGIFAPVLARRDDTRSWQDWIYAESNRRILAACFLLDVHSLCYFRHPPVSVQGLDYSCVSRLHIPLSAGMDDLWDATDCHTWYSLAKNGPKLKLLSTTLVPSLTADEISNAPPFDAAIILAGCYLQLRATQGSSRSSRGRTSGSSLSPGAARVAGLFQNSGIARAYLAFHHTPMHEILSVSGDSWLFNEKILQAEIFMEHRQTLSNWSTSNEATAAVFFAVRGIVSFLNLYQKTAEDVLAALIAGRVMTWPDISDYWGLYVCTLICWAWGQGVTTSEADHQTDASKRTAIAWILTAAEMNLQDLGEWTGRRNTRPVVCLIQDILERGCPGGRNRLFGDAVGVLKRLGDRTAVDF